MLQSTYQRPKSRKETLVLPAQSLAAEGRNHSIQYAGKYVDVYEFNNSRKIANSIINSLKQVKRLNPKIIETFDKYFRMHTASTIKWDPSIGWEEKNQLGKYLGELIFGYIALSNKAQTSFNPKVYIDPAVSFCIPHDARFKGIDSFLRLKNGKIIPISNKFGYGARAAFFGNILPNAVTYASKAPRASIISQIIAATESLGYSPTDLESNRGAKNILWEYGVRNILKISTSEVKNSYSVYEDIKKGYASDDVATVISAIMNYPGLESIVKQNLPHSATAFFSRTTAQQLNKDKKSIDFMIDILSGKDFYQASLDITQWHKGNIKYRLSKSGHTSLDIIGNKSAVSDIQAFQGTLNFELKKF